MNPHRESFRHMYRRLRAEGAGRGAAAGAFDSLAATNERYFAAAIKARCLRREREWGRSTGRGGAAQTGGRALSPDDELGGKRVATEGGVALSRPRVRNGNGGNSGQYHRERNGGLSRPKPKPSPRRSQSSRVSCET